MRLAAVVFVVGCGASPKAADPPAAKPDVVISGAPAADKVPPCEDAAHLKGAKNTFDCAVDYMKRNELETSSKLLATIKDRFPYSKYAVLAEEMFGDLEAAAGQYDDAIESYELFIKFHPTHEHLEAVKQKLADVRAKAGKAP